MYLAFWYGHHTAEFKPAPKAFMNSVKRLSFMLGWFVSQDYRKIPLQFSLNFVEQETTRYILERIQIIRWIHTVMFTYVIANCLYYKNKRVN